jgi:hypothetical protein
MEALLSSPALLEDQASASTLPLYPVPSSSWKASPCACILINFRLVYLNQACGMLKRLFSNHFETKCGNIGGAIPHQQHQLDSIACALHPTVLRPFLCEILQLLDEEKSALFPDLEWVLHGTHAVEKV